MDGMGVGRRGELSRLGTAITYSILVSWFLGFCYQPTRFTRPFKMLGSAPEEMAHWLKAVVLTKDLGSISSTHMMGS